MSNAGEETREQQEGGLRRDAERLDWSIVIPAYNEEGRLGATLEAIGAFLASRKQESEVIVVDGGGGLTSRNYKKLVYESVRRPVYPLDID